MIQLSKRVSAPLLTPSSVQRVWRAVQHTLRIPSTWTDVSVVVVGDQRMKTLNGRYRRQFSVTDVLSFPYGSTGGEVVVCYPQAKRQAQQKQVSLRQELNWLLVHGFLHLLGYDHERPRAARVMRPLEQRILGYV